MALPACAVLQGTRRLLHVRRCHSISPAGGAPSSKPTARCCSRDRWDRRTERTDAVPLHVPLHSIWAVQIRIRALCHVCLEQSETSVNPALTMFPGALSFISQQCVKNFIPEYGRHIQNKQDFATTDIYLILRIIRSTNKNNAPSSSLASTPCPQKSPLAHSTC